MRRKWNSIQWPLAFVLALAAIILGFIGFARFSASTGQARTHWDTLYLAVQLFAMQSGAVSGPVPWQLQIARFLAPAAAAYAALGALAILFRDQLERFRIRFLRSHTIICGLGRKGMLLAEALKARGERVVLIESDTENDFIEAARDFGALVLLGDARAPRILRKARVNRASHLVVVTGDDGVNADVAVRARGIVTNRKGPALYCLAHIVGPELRSLLRVQEMGKATEEPFRVDFFNVFEGGARALLRDYPVSGDRGGWRTPEGHIVVVGLGQLGENLVLHAARDWRINKGPSTHPLRVTIVDQSAASHIESLLVLHPWLGQVCQMMPVEAPFDSREFAEAQFLFDEDGAGAVSTIFICVDDDSQGISAALLLYRRVKDKGVPIVIRTAHGAGLASLLRQEPIADGDLSSLQAFGLLDRMCNPDLLLGGVNEILARAMHEEYLKDRRRAGEGLGTNPALVPWSDLEEGRKESNRAQAAHIGTKLAAIGCDLITLSDWDPDNFQFENDELEKLAEMEHDRWVKERKQTGWTLGPKQPEGTTSPYLVPWRQLDEDVRELDRTFIRTLPDLLARSGFQIVRIK